MKLDNTIFQTKDFKPNSKCVIIDDNEIYYEKNDKEISIDSSLIPFIQYDENCFKFFFNSFPEIKCIKIFRASETNKEILPKNTLKIKHFDNNLCLTLPENIDLYKASLGKKTRMHLGQYLRHVEKEVLEQGGGYFIENFSNDNKQIFDNIVALNKERASSKGLQTGNYNSSLWDKLKDKGVLIYLMIGNRIIAGTIGSIFNNQFNLFVIAHSNDYGKLNPGNTILYKTIEYAINKKIKYFNFLWGNCEYKSRFGAQEIKIYNYIIYRKKTNFFKKQLSLILTKFNSKFLTFIKSMYNFAFRLARFAYHHTIKRKQKSLGYIIMLHRVDEYEKGHLWCNEHMKITPVFLEKQIQQLKEEFDFIPLSKVPERLKQKNIRKFIVFTMDDGYKDNYTKALPVFKKYNVPYTIFVASDFPDKKAILWWYELEDLLLNNTSIKLSNGITYQARFYEEKCESFLKIREEILKLNQLDLENELNKLFDGYNIKWTSKCEELCLSWNNINQLKKEPLVTIGAHTQHHYNLKELETEEDVRNEVISGFNRVKEMTDIESPVFAYPFGSPSEAGDREFKILSELPFVCSCKACDGACAKRNRKTCSSLPRYMMTKDFNIKDLK